MFMLQLFVLPRYFRSKFETFEKRPLLPNLGACLCRAYLPFQRDRQARQTGQAQILMPRLGMGEPWAFQNLGLSRRKL